MFRELHDSNVTHEKYDISADYFGETNTTQKTKVERRSLLVDS